MKEKQYNEMCSFLANDDRKLGEFKDFYNCYNDSDNYNKLFENKYGFMYRKFMANAPVPSISDKEYREDIRTIRQWVQFTGIVMTIGVVFFVIMLIYLF